MPFVTVGTENSSEIEIYYEDHGAGQPVHDQDAALTASHVRDEPPQDLQLAGPAEQPARRMRGHAHHPE